MKLISTVRRTEKSTNPQTKEDTKEVKVSTTDPESGYYVKDEREKLFAYSFHTASDSRGFILGSLVTGANVYDSRMLEPLVNQLLENVGKPTALAVDAGYKTPPIAKFLMDHEIQPKMDT
jgi:Transposase DDE domain